jgi:hypothetical protein
MLATLALYNDLILVLGIGILALAFPSMVGSFSRGQPPRVAMIAIMVGGGMIVYANGVKPGGYDFALLPQIVAGVFSG